MYMKIHLTVWVSKFTKLASQFTKSVSRFTKPASALLNRPPDYYSISLIALALSVTAALINPLPAIYYALKRHKWCY